MSNILFTLFLGLQLLEIPENIIPAWLTIFKEYPILNNGTPEGVKRSLKKFSSEPHCAIVIAETLDHNVSGIATGIPLVSYYNEREINELFKKARLDPFEFYHINDLVVLPEYRQQGIASKLCKELENQAQTWGYTKICLCTIEHNKNHPLKPSNYYDPALFWRYQGFSQTSMKIKESWPTIMDECGNTEMHEHSLIFWVKDLKQVTCEKCD